MRLVNALLVALALVASVSVARAHPHIWIRATAVLQFENGKITGIQHEWLFDDFFSNALIEDFDKNKNKAFDPAEVKDIEANAFAALKEYGYFTHLRIDAKRVAIVQTRDFTASIKDGRVIYRFVTVLPEPVDPRAAKIDASLYDESYYVDVEVNPESGITIAGTGAEACKATAFEDRQSPLYFGAAFARRIEIICAK